MLVRDRSSHISPQETHVLFEEARQRRRQRWVVGATIVLVGAALAAVLVIHFYSSLPGARTPPADSRPLLAPHTRTGATLIFTLNNLRVINADTGASRTLPLPAPAGGASDGAMVRLGDSLLLNKGDTAWLYPPGLRGAPVDLGPSLRIIPGPAPDEVWLWSDPSAAYVRLVDFSGRQIGPPIALPVDTPPNTWFPTGEVVGAALVLAGVEGGEEVWDPISNRVIPALPRDASVIGANGHQVAWERCLARCTVHLTDMQTGIVRNLPLPTGAVSEGGAFLSPNGAMLAVPVGLGGTWPGRHPIAMVLANLRTRAVWLLPDSEQEPTPNLGPLIAGWSRTGWLFFTAYGSSHVLAWHPGDQRALVLPKTQLPRLPRAEQPFPTLIAF